MINKFSIRPGYDKVREPANLVRRHGANFVGTKCPGKKKREKEEKGKEKKKEKRERKEKR